MPFDRLLHPPPSLPLEQRRAWRLLSIANGLVVPWALLWGILLLRAGDPVGAIANLLMASASLGALVLLAGGQLRASGRLTLAALLLFSIGNALWLSPPAPEVPRAAHQYLLALALGSLLITTQDPPWVRTGVPLACLLAYIPLAGSHFSLAEAAPVVDAQTYAWGSWVAHGLSMTAVLAVIHVLQSDIRHRAGAEAELRDAILRHQLELHYQPQVDLTGRVRGAEALVRWRHPRRGLVPPGEFIPLAEASGLIVPLGEWVLQRSCQQLAAWSAEPALRTLPVSVNVGAAQFEHPDFVDQVRALLVQHGVAPARLKIELTEGAIAKDLPTVIAKMAALRAQGLQVSLDDFGTGFSSLSALQRLPLDQLKIDQSFVRDLGGAAQAEAIVRTIIGLGQTLGLEVVAEGVETADQRDVLIRYGCRQFQGYLFAHPVPASAMAALVGRLDAEASGAPAPARPGRVVA